MKAKRFFFFNLIYAVLVLLIGAGTAAAKEGGKIVHDAEYYVLEAQHGDTWAVEDKELDQKLEELRKKHGKAKSLSILAHKLGRAVYFMMKNDKPFSIEAFRMA